MAETGDARMDCRVIVDVVCEMPTERGTKKKAKNTIKNFVRENKERNTLARVRKLTEISTLKSVKPETC